MAASGLVFQRNHPRIIRDNACWKTAFFRKTGQYRRAVEAAAPGGRAFRNSGTGMGPGIAKTGLMDISLACSIGESYGFADSGVASELVRAEIRSRNAVRMRGARLDACCVRAWAHPGFSPALWNDRLLDTSEMRGIIRDGRRIEGPTTRAPHALVSVGAHPTDG